MRAVVVLISLVGLAIPRGEATEAVSNSLGTVCEVDWRGTPLAEALGALAGRLGVGYILDSSVDAAALGRSVRMSASHLTGAEAFRWLARSTGLAAVLVEGTFLIAAEERLPAVWRARGEARANRRPAAAGARWGRVQARRADINWVDAPLSGVARDISAAFGVDVVFDRAILADQGLIHFAGSQVSLEDACGVLAERLGAKVGFVDGAVWVCRGKRVLAPMPATAPVGGAAAPAGDDRGVGTGGSAASVLGRRVRIDRTIGTWPAFAARLAGAGGFSYRVEVPPGAAYSTIEASGSVAVVLEAARLLGRLSWTVDQEAVRQPATLKIQVHGGG